MGAAIALAVIGPMPGIVRRRRLAAALRHQARIRLGLSHLLGDLHDLTAEASDRRLANSGKLA